MTQVEYAQQRSVAVLTLNNPPVNSLGKELRRSIVEAIARANADGAVKSIVMIGKGGGTFSAGADIREFGTPEAFSPPELVTAIAAVESSAKPVVAAIGGVALGGGLELALGCHYRVATQDAKLGLPEVKLGLLPGAGGTQRLPRLLGIETSLNMIISGEPIPATQAAGTPLIAKIIEGDLLAGAVEFAQQIAANATHPRARDHKIDEPKLDALLDAARKTAQSAYKNFPAPLRIVDVVGAAAKLSFDAGMAAEDKAFRELMDTSESKACRHMFFAERAAARIADVPESTPVRSIKQAAVIGAGTMGGGIAMCFLNVNLPVLLLEVAQDALDRGVARIRETYQGSVKKGKLTQAQLDQRMALLKPVLSYDAIAQADIVIEAVFEDMGVKEKVFQALDRVMKPGAILATNTSTLDVNHIAKFTQRPQDVIGTHFFSPANIMRLLEVVRGAATAKDVLATVMKLGKTLKKTAVVSGVCDGFIGNRMVEQYSRQAGFMLDEGASPQQIDSAIEKFGFAMGPFRMSDLAGNDIGWHIRKRRAIDQPDMKYSASADRLCELGRFGQKTGAGWYDYKPGDRTAYPSKVVEDLLTKHRADLKIQPRNISDQEIVDRLVYALVNEGAKILEEKIAARASDIDLVYLTGYGFPAWRGGPMLYADLTGLPKVVTRMKEFAANRYADPAFWTPASLMAKLAAEGKTFNG